MAPPSQTLQKPKDVSSILVISMGDALGDATYKIPFLEALTAIFPNAKISWYVGSAGTAFSNILAFYAKDKIDEIIVDDQDTLRSAAALFKGNALSGRAFDIIIDTQLRVIPTLNARRALKGRLISRTLGGLFSDVRPLSLDTKKAVSEHLAELGHMTAGHPLPHLSPTFTDERAEEAARHVLPAGKRYVGVAPGAGGVSKRWPLERFIAVGEALTRLGATPVFLVGPAELEFIPPIRAALPGALFPEIDRTDAFTDVKGPRLLLYMARRLEFTLSNDAGVGHVCGLGGSPMVTIFPSRRMAKKFPPPGQKLASFAGDDFGAPGVQSIPQDVVIDTCAAIFRNHRPDAATSA